MNKVQLKIVVIGVNSVELTTLSLLFVICLLNECSLTQDHDHHCCQCEADVCVPVVCFL